MSVFGCRCLNVTLNTIQLPLENLPPQYAPPRENVFPCQRLGLVDSCNVCCEEPSLLEGHKIELWTIYRCMICSTFTHASFVQLPHPILINLSLVISSDEITSLRNSSMYSPLFRILLNETNDDFTTKKPPSSVSHPAVGNLSKRLARDLQSKMESIEDEVRLFRENKNLEFEEYKERAHQDFKIITNILFSQENVNSFGNVTEKRIESYEPDAVPVDKSSINKKHRSANRTNSANLGKQKNNIVKNLVNIGSYKEDSLDSEGIFDLEGMDSSTPPHDHNSDAYDSDDSDSDDSVSRDEGIHCAKVVNEEWRSSVTKSLPVNLPTFIPPPKKPEPEEGAEGAEPKVEEIEVEEEEEEQMIDDPNNIAASIKALARSVHNDVFDLPRPRFSTQI